MYTLPNLTPTMPASSAAPITPTTTPTPTAPASQSEPTQLDPQVVNLSKAIRKVESNNDYTAKGSSGEYGAYQWMPATWAADSQKYLGEAVPAEQATPEQQNEVAYKKIAAWKAAGYNVGQIASMWNAGGENPNAYITGNSGTNSAGVNYNTAAYAKKVAAAYQQFKTDNPGFNATPFSGPNAVIQPPMPTNNGPTPTTGSEVGSGILSGLGQAGQSAVGALKSIPASLDSASQAAQGLMSKLVPGGAPIAKLPNAVTQPTSSQTPGFVGGLLGQLAGGAESAAEAGGTSIPEISKGLMAKLIPKSMVGKVVGGLLTSAAMNKLSQKYAHIDLLKTLLSAIE